MGRGALIAVADVAEEEITESVFLVCVILDFARLLVCVLCTRIPTRINIRYSFLYMIHA